MSENNEALVLTSKTTTEALGWTQEDVAVIKQTICAGASDAELRLFLYTAKRLGLDPLARQIYSVPYQGKRTTQVAIDGFRAIAVRTGEYNGQDPAEWCGADGVWKTEWLVKAAPVAARVSVYRKGIERPFVGFARYEAYCQRKDGNPTTMWVTKGDNQLAKCAEALALRKAFPQDLGGVYAPEEMEHLETTAPSNADKVRDAIAKQKAGPVQDAVVEDVPKEEPKPPVAGSATLKVTKVLARNEAGVFTIEFEGGASYTSPDQSIPEAAVKLKGQFAKIEFVGGTIMTIEPVPAEEAAVEADIAEIFPT